jgi:PilZ domain
LIWFKLWYIGPKVTETPFAKPRRSERMRARMAIVLLMDAEEGQFRSDAETVELSQHGCRIQGGVGLTQGQLIQISPSDSPELFIPARVVWVGAPASDMAGEAGVEFLQPFPPAA